MRSKKGLTFSIGMIVMLILTVLIFSMSLYFLFNWFGEAEALKAEIDRQTEDRIQAALRSGNQRVAIPVAIKEVKRGNPITFGIGIRNVVDAKEFSISLAFASAYTPNGMKIAAEPTWMEEKWLGNFKTIDAFTLKKNELKVVPLLVRADTNVGQSGATQKGDYVFNVCVWDSQAPQPCAKNRLNDVYTGKIYQITARVI